MTFYDSARGETRAYTLYTVRRCMFWRSVASELLAYRFLLSDR